MKKASLAIVCYIVVTISVMAIYTTQFASSNQQFSSGQISNSSTISVVGVGVFWNSACSNITTNINWGVVQPGKTTTQVIYIQNRGNIPETLAESTYGWNPSNVALIISFSWNYTGATLQPSQTSPVALYLTIANRNSTESFAKANSTVSFRFNIQIVGIG
jgi:hypothetical protein